ncbi:DUF3102 domain-containing protein [Clostridium tagluense]|uniref:DUF3102 domain-containing protein n=1 Tax=Clostridium tagluense TaxID=360422 RepID=UPI001C0BD727|nr:DUF3102 domain-containing protein [Clostridium tagluense]MBU3126769.1 DUF3102 domain-containing protein [Clostridium tagluense]
MNEIQTTVIDTLTVEILILKQQTAQNIIEIGKRLIAAKGNLPHGEWGKYLDEKVDFSQRTANNFMKVANEFSNSQTLANLSQSKVFALLSLPQEERETFVKENPVDEMSTRELQQAIKDRDKAEKEKEIYASAMKKAEDAKFISDNLLRESKEAAKADIKKLKDSLKDEKEKSSAEIAKLQSFIGEAKDSGNDEEVVRLQASLNEIQGDLDSSALRIDELESQLKEKPIDVITAEPVIIEKIPEEVAKELQELREKLSQSNSPSVAKFKSNHAVLNQIFKSQLEVMVEIKETDSVTYEKCKNAISNLISKMSERL